MIRQRLNRLSESCRQILVIASLIGREFNLQLLVLLNPRVSEEELLAMLDESLDAHLIDEVSDCGEGYYFSHALIQEVLAGELSGARRVRCHAQIGEAVEQLYAANLRAHATELAHHFARAQPVLGSGKIVRYFRLAGEEALAASSEATGSGLAPLVEADNLERAFSSEPVPKTGFSTTPRLSFTATNTLDELVEREIYWIKVSRNQEVMLNGKARRMSCANAGMTSENCWNIVVW